jgi:hypothetical protein
MKLADEGMDISHFKQVVHGHFPLQRRLVIGSGQS